MREMKYRGKRLDNGEWVTGWYLEAINYLSGGTKPQIGWIRQAPSAIDRNIPAFEPIAYDVVPATIGQWTGLKDPNGKEIYEGDIVTGVAFSVERVGEIVWINELAGFGVRYAERDDLTAWENSSILKHIGDSMDPHFVAKVIGNVHDNPSLLR